MLRWYVDKLTKFCPRLFLCSDLGTRSLFINGITEMLKAAVAQALKFFEIMCSMLSNFLVGFLHWYLMTKEKRKKRCFV